MNTRFKERGYHSDMIEHHIGRVKFSRGKERLDKKQNWCSVSFDVSSTFEAFWRNLLFGKELKKVFTPVPKIALRGARKPNSYLASAKLYPVNPIQDRGGGRIPPPQEVFLK